MAIITYPLGLREKANGSFPHVGFTLSDQSNQQFDRIHLYVPSGFSIPDAASYNTVDLGVVGGTGEGDVTEADSTAQATKIGSNFGGIFGELSQAQAIGKGVAVNPNTNLAFGGTQVRSFNFSFKMVSQSSDEANVARKIEQLFRKYMYPELAGKIAIKYPPQFQITFYNGKEVNKFMPKILPCYLMSVTATYNSSSNSFHKDGSPVEVDLNLAFQETKALTRGDLFDLDDTASDSEIYYREDNPKTNSKVS